MKKILITAIIAITSVSAYAGCRYYTITVNGKTLHCSECCFGNMCTTNCN